MLSVCLKWYWYATPWFKLIVIWSYENEDNVHYDKFNYLDQDNNYHKFQPGSDMAFGEFRKKMIEEWKIYKDKYNTSDKTKLSLDWDYVSGSTLSWSIVMLS